MNKIKAFLTDPNFRLSILASRGFYNRMSDEDFLKRKYKLKFGESLDLENPQKFQEKLQWVKLNDRKPIYHQMVDKYDAKKFISERVGEQYVIPTLGIWEKFDDIDFDSLPNKFIIKNTHDSGNYYICKDKLKLDKKVMKSRLRIKTLNRDYYVENREWPYKGLKPRIIAEPLLEDINAPYLRDFKFYCFNGEPRIFYITSDKGGNLPTKQDFFDIEGNHLDIQDISYPNNPVKTPDLPINLSEMVELCKSLSRDTYHLRVDLYEINGKVYVGELTFFEGSGFCAFSPEKYNLLLGEWIKLPIDNK